MFSERDSIAGPYGSGDWVLLSASSSGMGGRSTTSSTYETVTTGADDQMVLPLVNTSDEDFEEYQLRFVCTLAGAGTTDAYARLEEYDGSSWNADAGTEIGPYNGPTAAFVGQSDVFDPDGSGREKPGVARFRIQARSSNGSDSAELSGNPTCYLWGRVR